MSDEQLSRIAHNAGEVLESWHLMPGVGDDGSVDEDAFKSWVAIARERCMESKHTTGCDLKLGQVFARMPPDKDGIWPHVVVRNAIEEMKNLVIEKHIPIAIYNSRGVVSRSPFEGGEQERMLSQKYMEWSKALEPR